MKILFTSDWQTDYENLELCRKVAEEILRLKGQTGFGVLVLCGDLKHVYNPIDVRVVTFWLRTISKWRKEGLDVVAALGNHDRVGMHVDKQNWFPILRKAGALAYDETGFAGVGNGQEIAILPFRNSSTLLRREAIDLAKSVGPRKPVLVFHADLEKAKHNVLSSSEPGDKIRVEDLCPERYLFCIGGHIHYQQKVGGNVWYCGSPFATDWGEANQRKGYLFVDTDRQTIKRVRSEIPGWYDPTWPGFDAAKPESWEGAHVRIKVPVDGIQQIGQKLAEAEERARKTFFGARLAVVPEFKESVRADSQIRASYPDEKKIRLYVEETIPDELKAHQSKVERYLIDQLAQVNGLQRETGELTFKAFAAENFLSYKKISFRFEPGLCVVSGKNLDWASRSNGSGKTSFLQPIAVAHSGQTFKDQKHDKWMRRGTGSKDSSHVKLWFEDSQNRKCFLLRARQPKELLLKVEGEVVESGNRPESTQRLIEHVTGYTWETLSNTIYVDQARSHLMLTGTEAERKSFLARLQNLERFERAAKVIKDQKDDFEGRYTLNSAALGAVLTEKQSLLDTISRAKRILAINESIADIYRRKKSAYDAKLKESIKWAEKAKKQFSLLEQKLEEQREKGRKSDREQAVLKNQVEELKRRLVKFGKMEGACPTCLQEVSRKYIQQQLEPTEETIQEMEKKILALDEVEEKRMDVLRDLRFSQDKWRVNRDLALEVEKARDEMSKAHYELKQFQKQKLLLDELRKKSKDCGIQEKQLKEKKEKIVRWLSVLKYAYTVFQRTGLPAYLNAQICPELNQAAAEYSELFTQGEIQVRFAVDEQGKMDVQVINAHGGEDTKDQSEGEMKMASLITSFAVRSVAPKTNLLILDEPGDGLDATSARAFARGLKSIVGRFGTILLTTHNPAILSELSDARLVTIIKENKISRVEEE